MLQGENKLIKITETKSHQHLFWVKRLFFHLQFFDTCSDEIMFKLTVFLACFVTSSLQVLRSCPKGFIGSCSCEGLYTITRYFTNIFYTWSRFYSVTVVYCDTATEKYCYSFSYLNRNGNVQKGHTPF